MTTADAQEGVAAFVERRDPDLPRPLRENPQGAVEVCCTHLHSPLRFLCSYGLSAPTIHMAKNWAPPP